MARYDAYIESTDPFMHATLVRDAPARCDRVLPFRHFDPDLVAGRLPTVAFVVPDLRHDMHSGPVAVADAWLHRLFSQLATNPVWRQNTRVVVTFDEGTRSDTRSGRDSLGRGGRILTSSSGRGSRPAATPPPTLTTRSFAPSRPRSACPSSATPATRGAATIPAVAGRAEAGGKGHDRCEDRHRSWRRTTAMSV